MEASSRSTLPVSIPRRSSEDSPPAPGTEGSDGCAARARLLGTALVCCASASSSGAGALACSTANSSKASLSSLRAGCGANGLAAAGAANGVPTGAGAGVLPAAGVLAPPKARPGCGAGVRAPGEGSLASAGGFQVGATFFSSSTTGFAPSGSRRSSGLGGPEGLSSGIVGASSSSGRSPSAGRRSVPSYFFVEPAPASIGVQASSTAAFSTFSTCVSPGSLSSARRGGVISVRVLSPRGGPMLSSVGAAGSSSIMLSETSTLSELGSLAEKVTPENGSM